MPRDTGYPNWDRKRLVESIVGNIPDYNFDDGESDDCCISDEEVADLDWDYDRALEAGEIIPEGEESKERSRIFIKNISDFMLWACTYRNKGLKEPYDFQEWVHLIEKPEDYK